MNRSDKLDVATVHNGALSALLASNLRREFGKSHHVAVDDVSLTIERGQVLCLLGPNGAGKTTTVKMCSTLLTPTSGSVHVGGVDAVRDPRAARGRIGVVLGGERGFYMRASAATNLHFFADVLGVPRKARAQRVQDALELVGLTDRATSPVAEFSRGMLQRLHLARGLLNDPEILLLDEPTNGLDPEIARDVRALVRSVASRGVGVLLTTHYLVEAEQLADRVLVIDRGRVLASGTVGEVVAGSGVHSVTTFTLTSLPGDLGQAVEQIPGLARMDRADQDGLTRVSLSWTGQAAPDSVLRVLADHRTAPPEDLVTRRASLEESYLALVDGVGR